MTLLLYLFSIVIFWISVLSNSSMSSNLLRYRVSLFTSSVVAVVPELLAMDVGELGAIINPVSLHTTVMAHHALFPALRLCESFTILSNRFRTPLRLCAYLSLKLLKKF